MYRGRILGIVPGNENRDVLGLMMGGLDAEAAREAVAEGARTTDSELAEEGDLV
jgi:simple sugar transport system ATP-binding protein